MSSSAQPINSEIPDFMRQNRTLIAASLASVTSVLVGSPFDSIKVRMQTHPRRYRGTWDCFRQTWHQEGFRGFFRGILPPLVTVNIVKMVSVGTYESMRQFLLGQWLDSDSTGSDESIRRLKMMSAYVVAGCTAGLSTSIISSPLEMIRNQRIIYDHRLSLQQSNASSATKPSTSISSVGYARALIRQHGWRKGLYSGYILHASRESFGTGVYWLTYETLHWILVPLFAQLLPADSTDINSVSNGRITGLERSQGGSVVHFLAGGLTGMIAWLAVFPLDLVKNVYQKHVFGQTTGLTPPQNPNTSGLATVNVNAALVNNTSHGAKATVVTRELSYAAIVKRILERNGWRGLYRGVWPTMIRAFPIHGLNLLVYEYFLRLLS